MNIPDDLKIFSFIYEYHHFVLFPLIALWAAGGFYFLFRLKKVFFLWLLIFPLVLSPLQIAFVYSGWHYRMELYNRFAKSPYGGRDIDCMPPEIRAEYAKHNYHPRFRDMKALGVGTVVLTPLLYILGGLGFVVTALVKGYQNVLKRCWNNLKSFKFFINGSCFSKKNNK